MNKLQTFWYALVKTFTSPSYYGHILKAPFSFSLKFYFFYFFLYALITTTIITVTGLLPMNKFILRLPALATQAYPEELTITIRNGDVSTNVPEPYAIPVERVEKLFNDYQKEVLGSKSDTIRNIFVVDTKASIEDIDKYNTFALLTKSHISYRDDRGTIKTVPLDEITNVTIDRKLVQMIGNRVAPYLPIMLPILAATIFAFTFVFLSFGKLTYLLVVAAILWVIAKVVPYPISYGKSYQIGLHLVVIPTTIIAVLNLMNVGLTIPYLETGTLAILGFLILNHLKTVQRNE